MAKFDDERAFVEFVVEFGPIPFQPPHSKCPIQSLKECN
jgi:hypothetical protein